MKALFLTVPLLFLLFQSLFSVESVNFRGKRNNQSQEDQVLQANKDIGKTSERMLQKDGTQKERPKYSVSGGDTRKREERAINDEILQLLETLNSLLAFKFQDRQLNDNTGVDQEENSKEEDESFKTFSDFIKSKFQLFRPNWQSEQSSDKKQPNIHSKSRDIKTETVKHDTDGKNENKLLELKKKRFGRQGENDQIPNQAISEGGLNNLKEEKDEMVEKKPKSLDRAMFLSPERLTADKKPFPEISSSSFGIIYQSPSSEEGKQQLLDKMLDADKNEKSLVDDSKEGDLERKAIVPDEAVFGSGKTRPFPEIESVLAAKYPSVSTDDNDRLDIGLPPTKEDKIDEIPAIEAVKEFSKDVNLLEEDDIQNRIENIEQEFLELDEKRSYAIIDPILETLRKNFVAINQKALLRDLRSHFLNIPDQTLLPSLTSNDEWRSVDLEKRAIPATPRMLEKMAIL